MEKDRVMQKKKQYLNGYIIIEYTVKCVIMYWK